MDEYYDDEYGDEFYQDSAKRKKKKLKDTNPKGAYTFEILFKNIKYLIKIENITYEDYKISAKVIEDKDNKFQEEDLISLKRYINNEGFFMAAKKWNLFY